MTGNNVLTFTRQLPQQSALDQLNSLFPDLLRKPVERNPGSPRGMGPAVGPYDQAIFYLSNGEVRHAAGRHIDQLRPVRRFTRNAVEYRCDALGLAVYISGFNQIKEGARVQQGVRVVAFDFDALTYTSHVVVGSAEDLLKQLHAVLLGTYNRLARNFNLAGFPRTFLELRTSAPGYPNITIDMA